MASTLIKVYAYRHRHNRDLCGVLEAVDFSDARNWLGSRFQIRKVKREYTRFLDSMTSKAIKDEIVSAAFKSVTR